MYYFIEHYGEVDVLILFKVEVRIFEMFIYIIWNIILLIKNEIMNIDNYHECVGGINVWSFETCNMLQSSFNGV